MQTEVRVRTWPDPARNAGPHVNAEVARREDLPLPPMPVPGRQIPPARLLTLLLLVWFAAACHPARGGQAELLDEIVEAVIRGFADDGDPVTAPAFYDDADGAGWAEDSLSHSYSRPPAFDRVGGGVRAEAADTAEAPGRAEAEARSISRVASTLVVHRAGRFRFEVRLRLEDIELSNAGLARAAVRAAVLDQDGVPVPGGGIGELSLELRPDGTVIPDGIEPEADLLHPAGAYVRTLVGPHGGVRLEPGRHRLQLELALVATAPLHAGPNQLAAIGAGTAVVRLR